MGGHVSELDGTKKFGFRAIEVNLDAFVSGKIDKTVVDYGGRPWRGFYGRSAPDLLPGFRRKGGEVGGERALIKVGADGESGDGAERDVGLPLLFQAAIRPNTKGTQGVVLFFSALGMASTEGHDTTLIEAEEFPDIAAPMPAGLAGLVVGSSAEGMQQVASE